MTYIYLALAIIVVIFLGGSIKLILTKLVGALIPLTNALEYYASDVEQSAAFRNKVNTIERKAEFKQRVSELNTTNKQLGITEASDEFEF